MKAVNYLPEDKAEEISFFADFIMKQHEERLLNERITQLISTGKAFDFLKEEEDHYTEADIKEPYNG